MEAEKLFAIFKCVRECKPYRLLLVEDNVADARLFRWALAECKAPVTVEVVETGLEAIHRLEASGPESDPPRPDAMLVDLNLPQLDGAQLLKRVKTHPVWRNIPVVIFSTSHRLSDRERCLSGRALNYYTKPSDIDEFASLVDNLVSEEFPRAMRMLH